MSLPPDAPVTPRVSRIVLPADKIAVLLWNSPSRNWGEA